MEWTLAPGGLQKRGIAAAHLGSDMEPREKRGAALRGTWLRTHTS